MDPAAWLQNGLDELIELGPAAESDPENAWRAAVLIARLLGSPSGPVPPPELVRRLPEVLAVAGAPDPQRLLDRVADELDSVTDAWGPLLDALLDTDDTVGVLGLSGQVEPALELARRVAALVSLNPERVVALGPFAEMRLETVREDAAARAVWSAVERAPASLLVEALPAGVAPRPVEVAPARQPRRLHSFRVPRDLLMAAAASEAAEPQELEAEGTGVKAWVYPEEHRMRLEVRGAGAGPLHAALIAERVSDGAEVSRAEVDVEISGGTAYADLGLWVGPENALHRLVASSGLTSSEVRIRLTVSNG